ncbi:MAG: thiosulfate oxidation carrier complex protein SoxZ [Gammaproteobacteria bacterium]
MAGESIKIRTLLRDGACTVRALIRHPMEVGRREPETGKRLKPHFITYVSCRIHERVVLSAHWGGGIAKNPYLSFVFDGALAGDPLLLTWEDNWGETDSLVVTL